MANKRYALERTRDSAVEVAHNQRDQKIKHAKDFLDAFMVSKTTNHSDR